MKALAIDCATEVLTVAAKDENHYVKVTMSLGNKQSEKLLPAIDYVFSELSLSAKDLDYTTLTLGPGTFTGLRLGLSTLKALSLSYGIPIYGIDTLTAYAYPYKSAIESVLSVLENRDDEYFYSFFVRGEKLNEIQDKSCEEILKQIDPENSVLVCGAGAKHFVDYVNMNTPLFSVHTFAPVSDVTESLFELAEQKIAQKEKPLAD